MAAPFGPPWIPAISTPANPAAGASLVVTVPVGQMWHLLGAQVQIVTTTAVANRSAFWQLANSLGQAVGTVLAIVVQTASLTIFYQCVLNILPATAVVGANYNLTLPDTILPEGFTVTFGAINLQALDQIQGAILYYEHLDYA